MTYDFELRLPDDAEAPAARLREAALLQATVDGADGAMLLLLPPSGRATLRVVEPQGMAAYLTAGLALGAPAEEAGELLERLATIAQACGARLLDPQLGRAVSARDRPAVERRYTEAAEYAVRWTGRASDPRGFGAEAVIPKQTSTLPTKALLGLLAIVAAAFWAGNALLGLFLPTRGQPSYYEPAPGEPAAWWQQPDAGLDPPLDSLPLAIAEQLRAEDARRVSDEAGLAIDEARREAERIEEQLQRQGELLKPPPKP